MNSLQSRKLMDNAAYHTVYKTIKNRLAAKGERPDASEDPLKNTAGEVMTSRDILLEQKCAGLQSDLACYCETIVSDQKDQANVLWLHAAQDARHKRENEALQKQILRLAASSKHQIGVVTSGKLKLRQPVLIYACQQKS